MVLHKPSMIPKAVKDQWKSYQLAITENEKSKRQIKMAKEKKWQPQVNVQPSAPQQKSQHAANGICSRAIYILYEMKVMCTSQELQIWLFQKSNREGKKHASQKH